MNAYTIEVYERGSWRTLRRVADYHSALTLVKRLGGEARIIYTYGGKEVTSD